MTQTIAMPVSGGVLDDVPRIGDADVSLSNEAGFAATLTGAISTTLSADGGNDFSWRPSASSVPDLYVSGQKVVLSYNSSTNVLSGTINSGATTVFTLGIDLKAGASDVLYTQYASLIGTKAVADGGIITLGGGNAYQRVLQFTDGSGKVLSDAVVTAANLLDGTAVTVNTSDMYIGAANNLMNAGERLTLDFAAAGVAYSGGSSVSDQVASIRLAFFNFDSAAKTAPDELLVTGYTVGGGTFTKWVTNADLDANGGYTVVAPDGALLEKITFEAGSQSSFKLGFAAVSSVSYDTDISMKLGYQITDANNDIDTGVLNLTLDGNKVLIGGAGSDILVGGAASEVLMGGAGNDFLTGGGGSDVFKWTLSDKGSPGSPAVDTVTDFSTSTGGDKLDLRDLLQGENKADLNNLDNYLHFEKSGADTVIKVSSAGGFSSGFSNTAVDQTIVLKNVDLVGSFSTDQQVLQDLLNKGLLQTD